MNKKCLRCPEREPSEFTVKRSGRVNRCCKKCCKVASALFSHYNERSGRKYYRISAQQQKERRYAVIKQYGGACVCCGESDIRFLALDHVNGDGAAHRKELTSPSGHRLVQWIRANNYPSSIQVLCHNCNTAKGTKQQCPHQEFDVMTMIGACG